MNLTRSCLVRPLDPRYPTNRAVLIILPIAGAIAAGVAMGQGASVWRLLVAALGGAGTAFVSWALARELAPDDNPAAFVSMALAFATFLAIPHTSVILVLAAVMLVRILNRSVGIPAGIADSLGVVAVVAWAMYANRNPLPAVVGAIAFALDATLAPALRRQWLFALLCLVLASLVAVPSGVSWNVVAPIETPRLLWVLAVIAAGFVVVIVRTQRLVSVCDLTGAALAPPRVHAGMVVALMLATTGLIPFSHGLAQSALIWAVLLGIVLSHIRFSLWKTTPSQA